MNRVELLVENELDSLVEDYARARCFESRGLLYPANSWHRPLDGMADGAWDWRSPVTPGSVFEPRNLWLNRLLVNIYEQDLQFLDRKYVDPLHRPDYDAFYDLGLVTLGKVLQGPLETAAFSFLHGVPLPDGVDGPESLRAYLDGVVTQCEHEESPVLAAVRRAPDPRLAASMLIVQIAPDALSEASAMARTLPGIFGEEQSALMSVFMDEYGLGQYRDKHGTLYGNLMSSVGLSPDAHVYYCFYLVSSLMLTNYFHSLCSRRANWFKYVGALFYLEATLPFFVAQVVPVLRRVFGADVDTRYFDEHGHIDPTHRRIVLDELVVTSARKYGPGAVHDILIGFESIRTLLAIADDDLLRQLAFVETVSRSHPPRRDSDWTTAVAQGESWGGRVESGPTIIEIAAGVVDMGISGLGWHTLMRGDRIVVPEGRPHALRAREASSRFDLRAA